MKAPDGRSITKFDHRVHTGIMTPKHVLKLVLFLVTWNKTCNVKYVKTTFTDLQCSKVIRTEPEHIVRLLNCRPAGASVIEVTWEWDRFSSPALQEEMTSALATIRVDYEQIKIKTIEDSTNPLLNKRRKKANNTMPGQQPAAHWRMHVRMHVQTGWKKEAIICRQESHCMDFSQCFYFCFSRLFVLLLYHFNKPTTRSQTRRCVFVL